MKRYFTKAAEFWLEKINKEKGILLSVDDIMALNRRNFENVHSELNDFEKIIEEKDVLELGVTLRRTKVKHEPIKERVCTEDMAFDENLESALLPYEPVLVMFKSADEEFFYVIAQNTKGYVLAKDIAVAEDRQDWEVFVEPKDFYILTSNTMERSKDFERLYMGVKVPSMISGIGIIPIVAKDGRLGLKNVHIEGKAGFNFGYLPFTEEKILNQTFLCMGDLYGWGGDFNSRDCSSFVGEVFRCFGIKLGRNVSNQIDNGVKNYDVSLMPAEEKERLICGLNVGSQLIFEGHTTIYIGEIKGKPYIIHALSSMGDFCGGKINLSKVTVTNTDITRWKNGKTFIESFTHISAF